MTRLARALAPALVAGVLAAPSARAQEAPPEEAGPVRVRRLALVIGSNDGGRGRVQLRYALSDAESVARVFGELGGVAPEDRLVLRNPDAVMVRAALGGLARMVDAARATPDGSTGRLEVVFYYSGHSDEEGLLPNGERVPYLELRQTLDALPADVRVAIVDSCSSGALTRTKGGVHRAPFLVDAGSNVKGYAILTSSAADESAQESDRLGGSFFTLSLVSGLRGAADARGDGRVTLNEAYQFAFDETLARTEKTRGGPQHPAYDIQLAGSGDLVITDLRNNTARLNVADEIEGRLFVRDTAGRLAAEVNKRAGRALDLALEPGEYSIVVSSGPVRWGARVRVPEGRTASLAASALHELPPEPTVGRGDAQPLPGMETTPGEAAPPVQQEPSPSAEAPTPSPPGRRPGLMTRIATAVAKEIEHEIESRPPRPVAPREPAAAPPPARPAPRVAPPPAAPATPPPAPASAPAPEPEGTYRRVPLVFSIVPGVSLPWGPGGLSAVLSTGFPVAHVGRVEGLQASPLLGVTGPLRGLQLSAIASVAGGVRGAQGAGVFNIAAGSVTGLQGAGVFNVSRGGRLAQGAGVFNVSGGPTAGLQGAGVFNVAGGKMRGLQVAGVFNTSGGGAGLQLGTVNVAGGDFSGAQIGVVNISSGKVKGLQLGLVNISDDIVGVPIGLVTVARARPARPVLWTGSLTPINIGFQFGSKYVYNVLALSTGQPGSRRWDGRWRVSFGLGVHLPLGPFYLELDGLGVFGDHAPDESTWSQGRLVLGWQPAERFSIFGGLTTDVVVSTRIDAESGAEIPSASVQPGYVFGIRF